MSLLLLFAGGGEQATPAFLRSLLSSGAIRSNLAALPGGVTLPGRAPIIGGAVRPGVRP